jgi:hypothetical protein
VYGIGEGVVQGVTANGKVTLCDAKTGIPLTSLGEYEAEIDKVLFANNIAMTPKA